MTPRVTADRTRLRLAHGKRQLPYCLLAFAVYVLGYSFLYEFMGTGTGILLVFPVILMAWFFGLKVGLLAGLGAIIINTIHLNIYGFTGIDAIFHRPGWMGSLAIVAIGSLVGRMSDLRNRLKIELDRVSSLQEACIEQGHHYQRVVENARQPILIVQNGTIIWSNRATSQATGIDAQTLTSKPFLEFVHPDDRDETRNIYARRVAGEKVPDTYELRVMSPNGSTRWFQTGGGSIDWFGKPATMHFLTDITDRKQAEQDYVEHLRFLQSLIDSIPNPVFYKDVNGVYKRCNRAFAEFLGLPPEQILGQTAADIAPSDLAKTYHERDLELIQQGGGQVYEADVKAADGDIRHVCFHKAVVRDSSDNIRGLIGVVQDFTEAKRTEADLRAKTEELDRYFNSSLDLLCIADTGGHFVRLNPEWEKVLGYSIEELEGRLFLDLVHPDDKEATLEAIARLDAQEEVLSFENRYCCKDGSYRWIEWRSRPQGDFVYAAARDITRRKRTEEDLARSREQFELAVKGSSDGIWDWDIRDNSLFLSPTWKAQLGFRDDELPNEFATFEGRIHPDDRARVMANVDSYLKGTIDNYDIEFRMSHKDGSHRWIRARGEAVRDNDGHPVRMAGSHTDITASKAAEEALILERDRLANVIDGTDVGIWEWNVPTGETIFNARWAQMLGYSLEELSPVSIETWKALIHPEDLVEAEASLQKHFNGEHALYEQEFRMKHKDGHWVWILDRGRVITRNAQGKPLLMFGTHMDITDRKAGDQALLESESRLRAITDSAQDAIVMMDPRGCISFWNPAAERIFGYSAEEASGKNLHDLVAPKRYHEAHEKAFAEFRRTGQGDAVDRTLELEALTKSGQEISIELSLSAIELDDGWHAVGLMRDITKRKESETRLKQALDQQDAIFESSLVGIMVLHDRIITKVNRRMAEMLGYDPHEIEGHSPEPLHLSYDNFIEFGKTYYWRLADTELVNIEYPLRHKDGHTVWCQFSGKAIDPPDLSKGAVWIIEDMTERRQAQEAIRKSEQKLSLHVQETPLAYLELGTDFVVNAWNPAAETIFGYTSDEAIGRSAADLIIVENTRQHISSVFQQILENAGGRRSTNVNRTKDGQVITCEWYNTPLTDERGHTIGIACLAMDITEAHRAQEELRQSEERFRLFFELGMIGMGIKAPDLSWVHCNQRLCEILGYSREELIAINWADLTHPEDREAVMAAYRGILLGQADSFTIEKRCLHKSGETVEVLVSAKCLRNTDGTVRSILSLFQDITARKRAMEALSQSEAQNRAIVSALPDLMFRLRQDGVFVDFHAPEGAQLAREGAKIIGNTLEGLEFPSDFIELVRARMDECLTAHSMESFEYSLDVNGVDHHYEARVTPCGSDEVLFLIRDITERKRAMERIRQQADFLKSVLESIPHPFYVIDPDTMQIKMANSATYEGTIPENATCHSLTHKSDTPCSGKEHPCAVEKVRESLKPYTVEHIHYDDAGNPRTVEVRAFPVLDNGNLADVIEYSTDITERKRVEMHLAMLATFAENNPGMIVTLDANAQMQYANPATEDNLTRMGLSVDELARVLPHNIRDLISRCINNGESVRGLEVRYGQYTLLWDFHPVSGQHIVHAFAEDISDRIRREHELRKLSLAINQSPTIVIITDPAGVIEYVNPHFTHVTGYTLMDAVGRNINIMRSGRHDNDFYRDLWGTITAGSTWNGRILNRRKNGELYWQRTTISPIFSDDGHIGSFLAVAEDITAEVKAQQQLMESDKLAAIGTLAAGVAHEFKNYLGGIIGNASFALDDLDKDVGIEAARETLAQIIEMGEKANDVAMSLLTFSKAQPEDYSPEDLKKIITRSIAMVEKELRSQSIEIVTYLEDDIPMVEVSASKIQQVLMNLFINAQHAIVSEGVVTVALLREGDVVHIKVGDTGPGITEDNLSRIFDPFFSTKGVWGKDELSGTGMGLAIGRNIAREHAGDLVAESVEGVGTCFTLTLPINRDTGPAGRSQAKSSKHLRLLLFTLNRKILSHYHPQASAERIDLMAVDSEQSIGDNLRRVANAVICDARFCAKIELFRMVQTCIQQGVPYVMVNCGQMEYQLAELFENSRRNFKGLPDLQRIITCVVDEAGAAEIPPPPNSRATRPVNPK